MDAIINDSVLSSRTNVVQYTVDNIEFGSLQTQRTGAPINGPDVLKKVFDFFGIRSANDIGLDTPHPINGAIKEFLYNKPRSRDYNISEIRKLVLPKSDNKSLNVLMRTNQNSMLAPDLITLKRMQTCLSIPFAYMSKKLYDNTKVNNPQVIATPLVGSVFPNNMIPIMCEREGINWYSVMTAPYSNQQIVASYNPEWVDPDLSCVFSVIASKKARDKNIIDDKTAKRNLKRVYNQVVGSTGKRPSADRMRRIVTFAMNRPDETMFDMIYGMMNESKEVGLNRGFMMSGTGYRPTSYDDVFPMVNMSKSGSFKSEEERRLEDMEERIRNGDTSVTEDMLLDQRKRVKNANKRNK